MMFWFTARIRLFLFYLAMAIVSLLSPSSGADLIERAMRQKRADDKAKLIARRTCQCQRR